MRALYVLVPVLGILVIGYRYYSGFIAARILALDDTRTTPAHTRYDGHNFYPTSRWVLFGHHFAAISGAGPLVGPVLAAQFGYAPGLLWLIAGVVLAGAVHDMIILWASTRRGGRSLAEIAHMELGTVAGVTTGIAVIFIVIIALAGLGLVVVNALSESPWGTFTIGATIPLALFMGFYMYRFRKGHIAEATVIGVIALLCAVAFGKPLASSSIGWMFTLTHTQLVIAMAVYGFAASVMPVWMLLAPRDYLSAFMKIGTIALLVTGVIIVNPQLHMPAMTKFVSGGGPIIPGPLFPFVFITIACGAISGFHGLIGSGTTPKMIDKESDIRPIGYGAMLIEGLVGIVALIAATSLYPGDYFAINVSPAVFATLGIPTVNLHALELAVGESVTGRTGGAVSLAVGMAQVFSQPPGHEGADGLLVPLRHHVRGPLHPDDRGRGHAGGALPGPGVRRAHLPAVRAPELDAGHHHLDGPGGDGVVLLHLDRQHRHHLADVRHQQPVAGGDRAAHRDDDHHPIGKGAPRLGDDRAARVPGDDDADRRLHERAGQLLADGRRPEPRPPRAGVYRLRARHHHDGLRRHHRRDGRARLDRLGSRLAARGWRRAILTSYPAFGFRPAHRDTRDTAGGLKPGA